MPSTNKTTNYELSQFVGADVPTWLGDYNGDMQKIDTAIHSVSENADDALQVANSASGGANTAQALAQSAKDGVDGFDVVKHNVILSPNITAGGTAEGYVYASKNGKIVQLSVYGDIPSSVEQSIGVITRGGNRYLPIMSCNDNCLKLDIGNVSTGQNVFRVGFAPIRFSSVLMATGAVPAFGVGHVVCVWTGSATQYYLKIGGGSVNVAFSPNNSFYCEITSVNAGVYDE